VPTSAHAVAPMVACHYCLNPSRLGAAKTVASVVATNFSADPVCASTSIQRAKAHRGAFLDHRLT